jgi:hypothetical protein
VNRLFVGGPRGQPAGRKLPSVTSRGIADPSTANPSRGPDRKLDPVPDCRPASTGCLLKHTIQPPATGNVGKMLNDDVSSSSLVGRIGIICAAVRGGELPGEVRIVIEGLPHYFLAYGKDLIDKGEQVLVINNRGSRQLDVEPWPHTDFGAAEVSGPEEGL